MARVRYFMISSHRKLKTQITEIERFLQRHAMVGCLDSTQQTEAGELRQKLEHRLGYLKILWYAEPNEAKFEELTEWITDVGDMVRRTINVMTVFMRAKGARLKTEHNICHQRTGFDNTYEMTGHKLPVEEPIVFRQQQGTYVRDTYEEAPYGSVPLWTNPPAVIQIQLQETVNRDQRPHPKPNQGRLQEHSRPDDRYSDKEHLDRWIWRGEETMTGDTRPWDPQGKRGARREGSPHSSSEEDLRNVIDRLGARKRPGQYKRKSQAPGQSTRERCEPYSRGTDPNEHPTRRHKYDTDLPPDREHRMAPYEQRGNNKTHERMLRWLSEDPTRFADAQRDMAEWKEYLAKAVKNPVFPLFVSMAYSNRDLRGGRPRDLRWSENPVVRHRTAVRHFPH
jgi:hypothetical protein